MSPILLILLIFCNYFTGFQSTVVCPHGYSSAYNSHKCYMFTDTIQVEYDKAQLRCATHAHGHLPVVSSAEENDALVRVWLEGRSLAGVTSRGYYPWLGLRCANGNCQWTNNAPYSFNLFDDSIADTSLGECVSIRESFDNRNRTRWVSTACEEPKLVICETNQVLLCDLPYTNLNGDCVLYLPELRLNYFAASSYCKDTGGFLLVIDNAMQNAAILEFLRDRNAEYVRYNNLNQSKITNTVFIGAKLNSNLEFEWSDGTPFRYSNFEEPFPNERYGHCAKLALADDVYGATYGRWQSTVCTTRLPFVCKYRDAKSTPPGQCPEQIYYADAGRLQSPNYPFDYGSNLSCVYHVNVDARRFVRVRFQALNLLDPGDGIDFYDGENNVRPFLSLSGSQLNDTSKQFSTPTSNLLRIHFHTAPNTTNVMVANASDCKPTVIGWHLAFESTGERDAALIDDSNMTAVSAVAKGSTQEDDDSGGNGACPSNTVYSQEPNGEVTTLGFHNGANYANFINCSYRIVASSASLRVALTFHAFRTERCCDFLFVHDGDDNSAPLLKRMSGAIVEIGDGIDYSTGKYSNGTVTIRSTGPSMTLSFISDSQVNDRGFAAEYSFFDPTKITTTTSETTVTMSSLASSKTTATKSTAAVISINSNSTN